MLFLLRNIRRKLLTDNKLVTYLLYAVGEIVLVVVGILIAVSIDDAQEASKKRLLKANYEHSLVKNLKEDSVYLTKQIKYYADELSDLMNLKERLERQETTLDTIVNITRYEYKPHFFQQNEMTVDIMDVLISTGDISLFDQTMIQHFLQLKKEQRTTFEVIDNQIRDYSNIFVQYMSKYSAGGSSFSIVRGELDKAVWKNVNKEQLARDFRGVFTYQIALMASMLDRKQKVLDQTVTLISILEN